MPKRTNDFQKLVGRIHRTLAPDGAMVTESAMVETSVAGETREIDVLMETSSRLIGSESPSKRRMKGGRWI